MELGSSWGPWLRQPAGPAGRQAKPDADAELGIGIEIENGIGVGIDIGIDIVVVMLRCFCVRRQSDFTTLKSGRKGSHGSRTPPQCSSMLVNTHGQTMGIVMPASFLQPLADSLTLVGPARAVTSFRPDLALLLESVLALTPV